VAVTPVIARTEKAPADSSAGASGVLGEVGVVHHIARRTTGTDDRFGLPCYGNGIVLNTPHGVTAPAPLMLCVPVMPGM
jgi:hypothetical protein